MIECSQEKMWMAPQEETSSSQQDISNILGQINKILLRSRFIFQNLSELSQFYNWF